jgi:hypothetical protein
VKTEHKKCDGCLRTLMVSAETVAMLGKDVKLYCAECAARLDSGDTMPAHNVVQAPQPCEPIQQPRQTPPASDEFSPVHPRLRLMGQRKGNGLLSRIASMPADQRRALRDLRRALDEGRYTDYPGSLSDAFQDEPRPWIGDVIEALELATQKASREGWQF